MQKCPDKTNKTLEIAHWNNCELTRLAEKLINVMAKGSYLSEDFLF